MLDTTQRICCPTNVSCEHMADCYVWAARQANLRPYPHAAPTPPLVPSQVSHPSHYTSIVPGIECIQVVQHFNFNRGNAIKYIWRAGSKLDEVEDLQKAMQYLEFEIARLTKK